LAAIPFQPNAKRACRAVRWLILLMVLCCDLAAIALMVAASQRS
jgi:hypothetical protein